MWIIINKYPWLDTNPRVNAGLQAAYGLAEAGEQVEFVVSGQSGDWQRELARYYGLAPHPNFTVRVIPRFRLGDGEASFPLYLYPFWRLRHWPRRESVTVFSREVPMLPFLALLKKLYGARIVKEAHNIYGKAPRQAEAGRKRPFNLEVWKRRRLETYLLRFVDLLVCITEPMAEMFREIHPRLPIAVLPLAARLRPSLPAPEKFARRTLIYVGRLAKSKGLTTLLEAMARSGDRDLRLLLVGGPERAQAWVDSTCAELGIAGRVLCLGLLPPAVLYRVLAQEASAGVLPLEDNFTNRHLTSPAKLGDYLSHSLPVIASRLPTTEALLTPEEALFFEPGDVEGLAVAIRELFADPARYAKLSHGAANKAQTWSWETRARELIRLTGENSPA